MKEIGPGRQCGNSRQFERNEGALLSILWDIFFLLGHFFSFEDFFIVLENISNTFFFSKERNLLSNGCLVYSADDVSVFLSNCCFSFFWF